MVERNSIRIGWPFRKLGRHPLLDGMVGRLGLRGQPVHVGWGRRPSGQAAIRAAAASGERLLILEDSFVRSIRPGHQGPVYGLLADSCGIHYDAHGKSDLLSALNSGSAAGWMRGELRENEDPAALMARFRAIGASKYNWFPGEYRGDPPAEKPGILVVDQTRGDMAIRCGGMAEGDFDRMLRAAFDECEGAPVYLRAHPDHLFRAKKTCFSKDLLSDSRIRLLSPDLSPAQCFSFCHKVMVGTSLMGMEALIHGCKVVTFGWPFFAGRGLTDDRGAAGMVKRQRALGLTELFEAAYLRYCHYFDPDTLEPCGFGDILDHLELQKRMFRENRGLSVTVGFSPWQRRIVPGYLRGPAGSLEHVSAMEEVKNITGHENARLLVWGRRPEIPVSFQGRCARIEDGFIRSRGLGAAFNFPYSWVIDGSGIYFDADAPSDLEHLLNHGFSATGLGEAARLIQLLREKRLTKYNLAGTPIRLDPAAVRGRKVVLVPGQVEADASIAFGSPELKSNLALLHRVREMEPDAYLIFKAHPDLVAGARHGKVLPDGFAAACDLAVTDGNVLDWLDLCHEVHTMTSTVGFEALIREVPVVTYGLPFYAGWGLTTDRLECPRRKRRLTLEELVCGALIHYPRYLNPETGEFTTALKVARVLTSETTAGDRRAWHLKAVSQLKKAWVELARS
jgi:capsular polysaccharide export protein